MSGDGRLDLVDNPAKGRFEATVSGDTAFVEYRREGDALTLVHTEVPESLRGHGVGGRLVRATLERAREEGLRVVVRCPFVRSYIERHPEYVPLTRNGKPA